jgi:transcriptional regulator with XRE-family HTH domain
MQNTHATIRMLRKIKHAREEAGLSQAAMAKKIEVSDATISKIESGVIKTPEKYLPAIAKATHKPLSYFFGEDKPELTEFAEKAKKYDEMMTLLKESGVVHGGGNNNKVYVIKDSKNVEINDDHKELIEGILQKDKSEHDLIKEVLKLDKEKLDQMLKLHKSMQQDDEGKNKKPKK